MKVFVQSRLADCYLRTNWIWFDRNFIETRAITVGNNKQNLSNTLKEQFKQNLGHRSLTEAAQCRIRDRQINSIVIMGRILGINCEKFVCSSRFV